MKTKLTALLGLVLALAVLFSFAACTNNTKTTEETPAATAGEQDVGEYISADGVRITYDPKVVEGAEIDDHSAQFVYIGESAGTNMLEVKYIPEKEPEEVLYEVTEDWAKDPTDIERSEGIFPGTTDKWGYWRILPQQKDGVGLGMTAIAGQYNGGTLLYTITSTTSGKDDIDIPVSDTLSEMLNGVQYINGFKDQTMYSYIPGTYDIEKDDDDYNAAHYESITLRKDHTGVLNGKDGKKTDIMWGSIAFQVDGKDDIEYTIEGDDLYVKEGNTWVEYENVIDVDD